MLSLTMNIPILPILAIVFLATLVRSTFGFGDALVAMPLLALVLPVRIAAPVMAFVGPTIAFSLLARERRQVDSKSALKLIIFTLAGIPFGLIFLKNTRENIVASLLATLIILFSLYGLFSPGLFRLKNDRPAALFGFIAGILGGAYNTNGPPVVLYGIMKGWKPDSFRATLQGYFLPTGGAILIGHGLAGMWSSTVIKIYVYALPSVFAAILCGTIISRKIPRERFYRYVYALLLMIGIVLLIKGIHPSS